MSETVCRQLHQGILSDDSSVVLRILNHIGHIRNTRDSLCFCHCVLCDLCG